MLEVMNIDIHVKRTVQINGSIKHIWRRDVSK